MTRLAVRGRERSDAPGLARRVLLGWLRIAERSPERLVAVVLVVGAVGFIGAGLARLVHQGDVDVLTLPLALLAADLLIAAALVTGWYPIRPVAQGLAIFGALVHVLVLLRSGPWWIRGWSGLLTVAHLSALVLFFSFSAREYDELDEYPEEPEASDLPGPGRPGEPVAAPTEQEEAAQATAPEDGDKTAQPTGDDGDHPPVRPTPAASGKVDELDTSGPDADGDLDEPEPEQPAERAAVDGDDPHRGQPAEPTSVAGDVDEPDTERRAEPVADTDEEKSASSSGQAPVADRSEEPT